MKPTEIVINVDQMVKDRDADTNVFAKIGRFAYFAHEEGDNVFWEIPVDKDVADTVRFIFVQNPDDVPCVTFSGPLIEAMGKQVADLHNDQFLRAETIVEETLTDLLESVGLYWLTVTRLDDGCFYLYRA